MFTYTKLDSFHLYHYRFKLPEALLTSKPLDNFPLDECKPMNPCITKKIPFGSCLRRVYNTDEHFYSSLIFCYDKEPPCTCQGFQISMEMRVSTRNGIGGPWSYKLEWIMAKGQGQDGRGTIAYAGGSYLMGRSWTGLVPGGGISASKEDWGWAAGTASRWLPCPPGGRLCRDEAPFKHIIPFWRSWYWHGELKMTMCSSKEDHLALSVLVYFNTILLFKLEHSISAT